MCGITGIFKGVPSGHALKPVLQKMADAITHRGPDDSGIWEESSVGLGVGHRRLSIVDLSPSGHQPMLSPCGRFVVAFNGEIYNHNALRRELESSGKVFTGWKGHSDTETLLCAFTVWGVEKTLEMATGMFAIALWDRDEQTDRKSVV